MYEIYTDGSCLGNPGAGGYGIVYLRNGSKINEESSGFMYTTNNRMELAAVLVALRHVTKICDYNEKIVIYSDSAYVINAIEKGWIHSWAKSGWKKAKNSDIWQAIYRFVINYQDLISFQKVAGHRGVQYNEECDKLAKAAASLPKEQLRIDINYEESDVESEETDNKEQQETCGICGKQSEDMKTLTFPGKKEEPPHNVSVCKDCLRVLQWVFR